MKIVIFCPVIEMSAIGMVNNLIVLSLQKLGHNVVVVRSESQNHLESPSRVTSCSVLKWNDFEQVSMLLETTDLVLYHIGNNYSLHCGGVEWLSRVPGLVCLHDYYLGHLFDGMLQADNKNLIKNIADSLYAEPVSDTFLRTPRESMDKFIENTKDSAPMTEWIAQMALGIIVHSAWDIQRLINSCPGFVCVQPLPYIKVKANKEVKNIFTKKMSLVQSIHILTIGDINTNKRVGSVIKAIGSLKNKKNVYYHIAGNIINETRQYLEELANEYAVKIKIYGQVSDDALEKIIDQSHITSCLRWPTLEAASASLIEALLNKRPTIVTNAGFYSELPDEMVFKIDPHNEVEELVARLDALIYKIHHDPDSLALHVENAYKWAVEVFCVEKYTQAILSCREMVKNQQSLLKITNHFAEVINSWSSAKLSSIYLPNLEIFW